jgi:hypothetical protein
MKQIIACAVLVANEHVCEFEYSINDRKCPQTGCDSLRLWSAFGVNLVEVSWNFSLNLTVMLIVVGIEDGEIAEKRWKYSGVSFSVVRLAFSLIFVTIGLDLSEVQVNSITDGFKCENLQVKRFLDQSLIESLL